jgi:hypothetical protein
MNRLSLCAAAIGMVAAAGSTAFAQYTITDGNSSAHFNTTALTPGSQVGMDNWTVDGVNHMYSQWFWIRDDSMSREVRLNALTFINGGVTDTNFDGNNDTLFLAYGGQGYTVATRFVLQGGANGSRVSDIAEQITITNTSTTTRTFSFFQYADFDLNGNIVDDAAGIANANAVYQHDFLNGTTVSETVFTPTFGVAEIGVFANTVNSLDDAGITTLNGNAGPLVGSADYTWALQWNITLLPGQSFQISKDLQITPAPGAVALMGMGGLAMARRRRR